jgi:hypothetical protein
MGFDATDEDIERRADNFFLENVGRAVFWAPDNSSAFGKRVLQGEVEVKRSLKPSALFPKFTTRVRRVPLDKLASLGINVIVFDV